MKVRVVILLFFQMMGAISFARGQDNSTPLRLQCDEIVARAAAGDLDAQRKIEDAKELLQAEKRFAIERERLESQNREIKKLTDEIRLWGEEQKLNDDEYLLVFNFEKGGFAHLLFRRGEVYFLLPHPTPEGYSLYSLSELEKKMPEDESHRKLITDHLSSDLLPLAKQIRGTTRYKSPSHQDREFIDNHLDHAIKVGEESPNRYFRYDEYALEESPPGQVLERINIFDWKPFIKTIAVPAVVAAAIIISNLPRNWIYSPARGSSQPAVVRFVDWMFSGVDELHQELLKNNSTSLQFVAGLPSYSGIQFDPRRQPVITDVGNARETLNAAIQLDSLMKSQENADSVLRKIIDDNIWKSGTPDIKVLSLLIPDHPRLAEFQYNYPVRIELLDLLIGSGASSKVKIEFLNYLISVGRAADLVDPQRIFDTQREWLWENIQSVSIENLNHLITIYGHSPESLEFKTAFGEFERRFENAEISGQDRADLFANMGERMWNFSSILQICDLAFDRYSDSEAVALSEIAITSYAFKLHSFQFSTVLNLLRWLPNHPRLNSSALIDLFMFKPPGQPGSRIKEWEYDAIKNMLVSIDQYKAAGGKLSDSAERKVSHWRRIFEPESSRRGQGN